jgi:hypothetical protein
MLRAFCSPTRTTISHVTVGLTTLSILQASNPTSSNFQEIRMLRHQIWTNSVPAQTFPVITCLVFHVEEAEDIYRVITTKLVGSIDTRVLFYLTCSKFRNQRNSVIADVCSLLFHALPISFVHDLFCPSPNSDCLQAHSLRLTPPAIPFLGEP